MAKSTKYPRPQKPREDFPLFPHQAGYWAKKIRKQFVYFGSWKDDPKGIRALAQWNDEKEDLLAGRTPRKDKDGLTIKELCNKFLNAKLDSLNDKEITARTFHDYKSVTDRLIRVFGKNRLVEDLANDDFGQLRKDISKTRGPVSLSNEIGRIRVAFNFAFDTGLIDRPVRYGKGLKKPPKKILREARQKNGAKFFEPEEVRLLLENADTQLKAMILLACNSGFGNSDIGKLPISAVDLKKGWITFPRPKTAVERRTPLWKETIEALQEALKNRPIVKDENAENLFFITKYGQSWSKEGDENKSSSANPISAEFRKLSKACGNHKHGRSFYSLRHTFQTVGEEAGETACRFLMGHVDSTMSAVYRERISDKRLQAVTDHVHNWLFPPEE